MATIRDRITHAWNAFTNPSLHISPGNYGDVTYGRRPDRPRSGVGNEKTIVGSIYNRIALDVSEVKIRHVRVNQNGGYLSDVPSGLNNCLTVEANQDQAPAQFIQDLVLTLFEEGCACVVPVDTTVNPTLTESFDIKTMRVGKILEWYSGRIKVEVFNDVTQRRETIIVPKRMVAIIENPFYSVMNEPNSTLKRLLMKLALLDSVDIQSSSGKLDIIIQLPYVIKSEARRQQAEQRRQDIEVQLSGSQYGIAYTDGTERITQLNRPAENNLLGQVEYLVAMLYSQLGITDTIMNGTAEEVTMINYTNRTIEPIVRAIVEAFRRSFLTRTARTQKQDIRFFRDPFRLVPVSVIAEATNSLSRNEIVTANEIRNILGFAPYPDPKADRLENSNMPADKQTQDQPTPGEPAKESQNGT
jgi:hypothetical protein